MVKQVDGKQLLDDVASFIIDGKAGDFVYRQGDTTTEMYVVQDGQIEILRRYAGEDRQVTVLETGDFFGEMSLLEEQPREGSARGITDYRLLRIDHSTFDQLLQENPEIAVRMLRKLSRRLHEREEADMRAAEIAMGALGSVATAPKTPVEPAPEPEPEPASMEALLVHPSSGTEFVLEEPESIVGRIDRATGLAPAIDLTSLDTKRTLSRRHARILLKEGAHYLREEIGTVNGTFVNGSRLDKGTEVRLNDNDKVRFGLVETVFRLR
jgi:hypothetical protein